MIFLHQYIVCYSQWHCSLLWGPSRVGVNELTDIYEKLPLIQHKKIQESESFSLLSMRTHTILWSLTIMISKYFISSNILRGICKIKNISNYWVVECFLSTIYFGDFDHVRYCNVIKLIIIIQFKGG